MPDDKSHLGDQIEAVLLPVRLRGPHLAEKHGIGVEQAHELIARIGTDRQKLDEAVTKLIT